MVPFFAASEKTRSGLKIARRSSSSSFSSFRALNRHNLAILARRLKLWPLFCSSWQADSKYIYKYHVISNMAALLQAKE